MKIRLAIGCLAASVVVATAIAHVDDPKARDLLPPVNAPAFRAAEGGAAAEVFQSSGVLLKSWLPLNTFASAPTSGNDCWGYVHPVSGREYAIIGLSTGTAFVEVTNPANAQIVGEIPGPNSLWRCVKTYGSYCYAGSEGGNGVQVIDMTNIDGTNGALPRVNLVREVTTGGATATHTIFVDTASGYLYRAGGSSNGLRIYDVHTDPSNPAFVGQWSNVYVHEAQIVTYTSGPWAGKQIAFCCGGANGGNVNTGMYIVDVTNKAAPVQLSFTTYPGAKYCHQSWLSNDQKRIYINDELDEGATVSLTTTIVMNVENLAAPVVEGDFDNGNSAIGHNLYIKGDRLFEANYRSGIRVFDLSQSAQNPPEVGFFDTWPGDDLPQFNGLWNVWPYFPSGTFIGSDLNRGLFVWRLGAPPAAISYPNGRPSVVSPAGAEITISAVPGQGVTLAPDAVKLVVTIGAQSTDIVMDPIGGNLYRGSFPPIACTTPFSYAFRIDGPDGPYADPSGSMAAVSATSVNVMLDDPCEAQGGWSLAAAGDNAATGTWINGDPVGTTAQPEDDHSASGTRCFVTGNAAAGASVGTNDIDGGTTTLTSPVFAASGSNSFITYWRWYSNDQGSAPNEDSMPVQISNDGGTTWATLETVTENANAWVKRSFRVADFVAPTASMRIRFVARDLLNGSVVEAGVDDVQVISYDCSVAIAGDINGDGVVNGADLGLLLGGWGQPGVTDLNGDGITNGADLGILLGAWAP